MPDNPISIGERCTIEGYALLQELSINLSWSWNRRSDVLWEKLDPALWELTHNPWIVFQTVSREKLEKVLSDPNYCKLARELVERNREDKKRLGWFKETHGQTPLECVAYFSMEFMLAEALPIYSGGLGNVAGDQLKAASDLGVPVVGIGLLYQQGYFRQVIDSHGAQQALYPYNAPGQLPITPLRKEDGEWLRLEIPFPGYSLWLRTWQVQVGRVKLFLLDSNDAANFPAHRAITSELYGGGPEIRLQQELILGIGGWRLLEALGITPTVCHLNEGHAAFVVLERALHFMKKHQVPFANALKATRAGNLFTTHTAVPAGFDRFSQTLIETYLSGYAKDALGISIEELMALGRANPNDHEELFNMAFLAMRGSAFCNGVSALHGSVSRHLFTPLFPRWPEAEIPIEYVTNGVHVPSWESPSADILWSTSCGKKRWLEDTATLEAHIQTVPESTIWKMRTEARQKLVQFARKRSSLQKAVAGESAETIKWTSKLLNPNILTLGFARRFATYKRPNLLLQNPERFIALLTNPKFPVQLLIAGKAHPADQQGQALIQQWSNFIKQHHLESHIAFLGDYDMFLAEQLVQGVDLWVNNPLRPWEACGTSGMKILANGGLNLSVLDGWWAEAYSPEVGWAIHHSEDAGQLDKEKRDVEDADALYTLLEKEVIPLFYTRNQEDIPEGWVTKIRASMAKLTPHYSANRAVREYTEKYYLPAAELYFTRTNSCRIKNCQEDFATHWNQLEFKKIDVQTQADLHHFTVDLALRQIDPKTIKVELFANAANGNPSIHVMDEVQKVDDHDNLYRYTAKVPATYPSSYYTARVRPNVPLSEATPLELPYILWQH